MLPKSPLNALDNSDPFITPNQFQSLQKRIASLENQVQRTLITLKDKEGTVNAMVNDLEHMMMLFIEKLGKNTLFLPSEKSSMAQLN